VRDKNRAVAFDIDALEDDLIDAQQGAKYPGVAHAVLRSPVTDLRQARNLGRNGVLLSELSPRHPRMRQYSRKKGDPHEVRSRPSTWTANASDDPAEG
jgi:hypothetical protein